MLNSIQETSYPANTFAEYVDSILSDSTVLPLCRQPDVESVSVNQLSDKHSCVVCGLNLIDETVLL